MNKDHQPKKTEQSARTGKKTGKGRRIGRTVGIVLGTILLVIVLTSSIFAGIFMTYVNTSLKGHVEVDMSEYDQKVSTELYYQDPETKQTVMYQTLFGDENRIWVDQTQLQNDQFDLWYLFDRHGHSYGDGYARTLPHFAELGREYEG